MTEKDTVKTYQITEASEPNLVKGRKWPPSNKISIKIMEETRKPSNHNFMIWPPFHKFSQHELIMLLS